MKPINFPQCNCKFGPPDGMDESQVMTIYAFRGKILKGSMDGSETIVTAWIPDENELRDLNSGKPVFLSILGENLPPHALSTHVEFL